MKTVTELGLKTDDVARMFEWQKRVDAHHCGECEGELRLIWGGAFGVREYFVACTNDRNHQGFVRRMSEQEEWESGLPVSPYAEAFYNERQVQSMQERGMAIRRQEGGPVRITYDAAMEMARRIWPGAPDPELIRAATICSRYNLDPYLKMVHLIKFKKRKDGQVVGESWETVLAIQAKRKMTRQVRSFGYADGPRMMTAEEQVTLLGYEALDPDRFWAITVLKDDRGNRAPGYGNWPKDEKVYGADKGNTPQHMAMIRSESQALQRLAPDEMTELDSVAVMESEHMPQIEVAGDGGGRIEQATTDWNEIARSINSMFNEAPDSVRAEVKLSFWIAVSQEVGIAITSWAHFGKLDVFPEPARVMEWAKWALQQHEAEGEELSQGQGHLG